MISCKASPLTVALVLMHMLFFSWVANASIPEESTPSVTKGRGLLPAATLYQYRVKRIEINDPTPPSPPPASPPPSPIGWRGGPPPSPSPIGSRGGPIKSPKLPTPRRPPPRL